MFPDLAVDESRRPLVSSTCSKPTTTPSTGSSPDGAPPPNVSLTRRQRSLQRAPRCATWPSSSAILLQTHLDIEDSEILPLFVRHYSARDWRALDRRVVQQIPKRGLGFAIPWNVAAVPAADRPTMIANGPFVLRCIYRMTKGRFARLVDAAFEGVDELSDAPTCACTH